jgi:ABC-type nitrate/sulfonate/bicarbonate transport system substrate-binding protein
MRVTQIIAAAVLAAALSLTPSLGSAQQTVRVGQGVPTLSFLPVWASRALNTFAPQGLTISAALMPGGDASALAALDAGDVDLAAVGSETALRAAAKGQPFEIFYSLMSKVTLQLVASTSFLESKGVKPGDPLDKRLAALKGAVIGVSGIGGAQEAAARWVAAKGGLDPRADIKVAQVGNPAALQAALENKRPRRRRRVPCSSRWAMISRYLQSSRFSCSSRRSRSMTKRPTLFFAPPKPCRLRVPPSSRSRKRRRWRSRSSSLSEPTPMP